MTVRTMGMAPNVDTAETVRLLLSLMMQGGVSGVLNRRSGLAPYANTADLTGVSPMVGAVSPFVAWIDGTSSSLQGGYPVVLDAAENITFEAGEAGVIRTDRVVAQIEDNPYDGSGFQRARVRIVKGQANGAATAVPASSLLLWEVNVPAGASIGGGGFDISQDRVDKRTWTTGNGGLLVCNTPADRDGLIPYEGQQIYLASKKCKQLYSGGTWRFDGPPLRKVKTNNDFSTNDTDMTNDTQLTLSLPANSRMLLKATIIYAAHQANDIKIGWAAPAGATLDWGVISKAASNPAGAIGEPFFDRQQIGNTPVLGGYDDDNFDRMFAYVTGTGWTGNGGPFTLQSAQFVAGGISSAIHENSVLEIEIDD